MKKALLAIAALLASTAASAQLYVGAAGGMSNQDINCSGWSNCDKSDTGFKLYTGFKFTPIVAGEIAYTDFGDVSLGNGSSSGRYSGTALSVGAAFTVPFAPKFSGIGRVGLAATDADFNYSGPFGSISGATSESSIEPYFGLGLAYALTPQLSLTGSFDYMNFDYPNGSGGASLLAIGVSYAF
jgi:OOP family OmpA-OmpF porin